MTLVEPSVSTAPRFLISAFALAMRWTPTESATDRVAGRPSGTRATMTPRANSSAPTQSSPSTLPMKKSATPHTMAMIETVRAMTSISFISGDFSSATPAVSE